MGAVPHRRKVWKTLWSLNVPEKKSKFSRGKLPTMGFLLKLISVIDILLSKLPVRCVVTGVKIVSMLVCNALTPLHYVTL